MGILCGDSGKDRRCPPPAVNLELTVGLSGGLLQALDAGELDLVLAKRGPGKDRGRLMRREKLVWVGSDPALTEPDRPLPLILYPSPSISRATGLEILERAGRSWRIVCGGQCSEAARAPPRDKRKTRWRQAQLADPR
jgi:DNA-binding transcriptional LysR family regulator